MSRDIPENALVLLLPLATDTPLWLSIVLALIALVAATSSIVVGVLSYKTAKEQRELSQSNAFADRNHAAEQASLTRRHASEEAERARQASLSAERTARLAVQRQAAFTEAIENLYAWSKLCHAVVVDPNRKASTGTEAKQVNERMTVDLSRLRLLGSSAAARHFARAIAAYTQATTSDEPPPLMVKGNAERRLFVTAAKRDLGVDPFESDADPSSEEI